ncbi:MAG: hypothetical protein SNJ56_04260, partial [Termitinemataceae bacterium]
MKKLIYPDKVADTARVSNVSFSLRTLATALILLHLHMLSVPLSSLGFFIGALGVSAYGGYWLAQARLFRPFKALLLLSGFPWVVWCMLLGISFFVPPEQTGFDKTLLFAERNFLISLGPFYWMAFTSYLASRSPRFLYWDRLANQLLLLCMLLLWNSRNFDWYPWPALMLAVFTLISILQFLTLINQPSLRVQNREHSPYGAVLLILLIGIGTFWIMLKPAEEQATEQGGGLIKPDLFRFDFSQYLKLESEISLKEDLVLILRKDNDDTHILLRRYILSGYDSKRGFFLSPEQDTREHPLELPPAEQSLPKSPYKDLRTTEQEYFLVNF